MPRKPPADAPTRRRPSVRTAAGALALLLAGLVIGVPAGVMAGRLAGGGRTPLAAVGGHRSIDHVVILVKENHTFDNLFAARSGGAAPRCSSYVAQGACSYTEADLPAYYRYARDFGLADRYFADVNGPSWPNHMVMVAGRTPLVANPTESSGPDWSCPTTCYDFPTIGDSLSGAGIGWRNYGEAIFDPFRAIRHLATDNAHNQPETAFFEDLAAGRLPAVSWVRPSYPESEHPGYDVRQGETWTVDVVNAVMRSPAWPSTAILVTWDDGGTSTDSVQPPVVERSGEGTPVRYGPRVPLLVISPYTPRGTVSHRTLSHVSLLRYVETRFGVAPLTALDRQAASLDEFFDMNRPPRPPEILPRS
jgi:phospholipase C